jgi:hypothetical protein
MPGGDPPHAAAGADRARARAADCPACSTLLAAAPAGAFDHDPHAFRCRVCHDPGTGRVASPAFRTCASAGCHVRAWPETPIHNLDPDLFVECQRCHPPHTWRPASTLCAGCHVEIDGPAGEIEVTRVPGVTAFSHSRHRSLGCGACHASGFRHSTLTIESAAECQACHHDPKAGRSCFDCHDDENGPHPRGARPVAVEARLSAAGATRVRTLPFDHDREGHAGVACARCHAAGARAAPERECLGCHARHDRPAADCAVCHEPPPAGAHTIAVHEPGDGCSGNECHGSDTLDRLDLTRSFCLACHVEMDAHKPGGDCAACHKIEMGVASGSMGDAGGSR